MAASKHLRAVEPGEKPKRKDHTVLSAAVDGDQLDLLYATRNRIARAITDESCPPRDLAALTKRLDDIVDKIGVLEATVDEETAGDSTEDDAFDASAI